MLTKKDIKLFLFLIILYFTSFFINNLFYSIITIFIVYMLIAFSKTSTSIIVLYSTIPCLGLFDNIGFTYFYNIAILILLLKMIIALIFKKRKINFYMFLLFTFLFIYNCILIVANNIATVNRMLQLISLGTSSLLLPFLTNKNDFNTCKIYYTLTIFLLLSFSLGLCRDITLWGFPLPNNHRLVGLMRDPNYFSAYASITIFSSLILFKKLKLSAVCLFFITFLSISKMFLLITIVSIIFLLITNFNKLITIISKKQTLKLLIFKISIITIIVIAIPIIFYFLYDKYSSRIFGTTLTTGRTYIWTEYLKILFSDNSTFLWGKSIFYNSIYNITYTESNMVAHNTIIDTIMSYGFFISLLIYISFIKFIAHYKLNKYKTLLLIIFFILIMSLSFLMADNFYILLLYVFNILNMNDFQKSTVN